MGLGVSKLLSGGLEHLTLQQGAQIPSRRETHLVREALTDHSLRKGAKTLITSAVQSTREAKQDVPTNRTRPQGAQGSEVFFRGVEVVED